MSRTNTSFVQVPLVIKSKICLSLIVLHCSFAFPQKLHFKSEDTTIGIVSCGGLCPGLNDVIKSVVYQVSFHVIVWVFCGFAVRAEVKVPKILLCVWQSCSDQLFVFFCPAFFWFFFQKIWLFHVDFVLFFFYSVSIAPRERICSLWTIFSAFICQPFFPHFSGQSVLKFFSPANSSCKQGLLFWDLQRCCFFGTCCFFHKKKAGNSPLFLIEILFWVHESR